MNGYTERLYIKEYVGLLLITDVIYNYYFYYPV